VELVHRFAFAFGGVHWISAAHANEATRDQNLAAAVSRIEQEEMRGWVQIAAQRSKQGT
jgi:hypothetical protein